MFDNSSVTLRIAAAVAAAGLGAIACDAGSATDPISTQSLSVPTGLSPAAALGSAAYPGVKVGGKVTICKDASSPAGTYHFHVVASPIQAGDLLPSSGVNVTPGACSVVWERPAPGGPATNVTVTEVIPSGATYRLDHITAVDDASGTRNVAGPGVTVQVKGEHGAVATFFNVSLHPPIVTGTPHHPTTSGTPHHPTTSGTPHHPTTSGTPHHPTTSGTPHHPTTSGTPHHPTTSGTPHHPTTSSDPHHPTTSTDSHHTTTSNNGHRR